MAFYDVPCVVAAVVASAHDALISFNLFAKRVLAAREDDTHCGETLLLRCKQLKSGGANKCSLGVNLGNVNADYGDGICGCR